MNRVLRILTASILAIPLLQLGVGSATASTGARIPAAAQGPTLPPGVAVNSFSYGPGATSSTGGPETNATSWNCVVYASDPYKTVLGDVGGDMWQSCSGYGYSPTRVRVAIQRQTLGLLWKTVYTYTGDLDYDSYDYASAVESCKMAGGNGKFRIKATGFAVNGSYSQDVYSLNTKNLC